MNITLQKFQSILVTIDFHTPYDVNTFPGSYPFIFKCLNLDDPSDSKYYSGLMIIESMATPIGLDVQMLMDTGFVYIIPNGIQFFCF